MTDKTPTLRDSVIDRLRWDIVTGALRPGSVVRDLELAERYGTSTSPVREALSQLATERLIEMPANRLKRVAPLDKTTSRELVAVFCVLATTGYGWGAPRLTDDGLAVMRQSRDAQRRAADAKDHRRLVELLWSFHDPVFIAAGNGELRRMLATSFPWLQRLVTLLRPPGALSVSRTRSSAILDAFQRGQGERAVDLFKLSLDEFRRDVERMPDLY